MKKKEMEIVAAIDVGSNYLRMSIAELYQDGKIVILEDIIQRNNIGRDTFSEGRISTETIKDTCDALKGFTMLMKDYRIKNYRAIATSGIREADNRDFILEQIRLSTGIEVEIINNAQERFFMYKALRYALIGSPDIDLEDSLIVNITSGGVEVSTYENGALKFTEYIKLGSLRLREILGELENKTISFPKVMEEFIDSKLYLLKSKIDELHIKKFIGLGGELSTILSLCKPKEKHFIKREYLDDLYSKIREMSDEQIIRHLGISSKETELLLPAVLVFHSFLSMTKSAGIYTPMLSLRHGILNDMVDELFEMPRKEGSINDIISSVWYIASKYGIDQKHAEYVEKMALIIFDETWKWHRLGAKEKLYLRVAAILHDTGNYVNFTEHDIHSYSIIRTQNIMGFSDTELELIANIARYHMLDVPTYADNNYNHLSHKHKIIVSKLSAILKLAESMDISHMQKIHDLQIITSSTDLFFKFNSNKDILLEQWDFMNNIKFFEEVMGVQLKLKG